MKKIIPLLILSIFLCTSMTGFCATKTGQSSALSACIKLYKSGNYVQAYSLLTNFVQKDPSNALAYYYLAMSSAQIGKRSEAISNYDKVLSLAPSGKLGYYANKGKNCIENPSSCNEDSSDNTSLDNFIQGSYGSGFSNKFRGEYENLKIQNMMREMNRNEDIDPAKFKEYSDFSSKAPTNDEIVNALRVLQRAGLNSFIAGGDNYNSELSLLTRQNYDNSNNYDMLNMLLGKGNSGTLSPQVIQSLLTNQMSAGF